jgi:hypothetical protein
MFRVDERQRGKVDGIGGRPGHRPMIGVNLRGKGILSYHHIRFTLSDQADELLTEFARGERIQPEIGIPQHDRLFGPERPRASARLFGAHLDQRFDVQDKGTASTVRCHYDNNPRTLFRKLRYHPAGMEFRIVGMGDKDKHLRHNHLP